MSSFLVLAASFIVSIHAQLDCDSYENCTDCVNDAQSYGSCEWHQYDDYCYDYWQQPMDDDDYGYTYESQCPEYEVDVASAVASIIIVVVVCIFCYVCIPCGIYFCCFAAFKAMFTNQPVQHTTTVVTTTQPAGGAAAPAGTEGGAMATTAGTQMAPVGQ